MSGAPPPQDPRLQPKFKNFFVKKLFNQDATVEVKIEFPDETKTVKIPLLSKAVIDNDEKVFIQLVRRGADPNKVDSEGHSPLWYAAWKNRENMVHLLLENGASPNPANKDVSPPLHISTRLGFERIVLLLVQKGANVNYLDDGRTPLMWAARENRVTIAELLLKNGAAINGTNNTGTTALMVACQYGHIDTVRFLLSAGANPNITERGDWGIMSALDYAPLDIMKLLLDNGARPQNALFSAIRKGSVDKVKVLLDYGANIDQLGTAWGVTPLMAAIRKGELDIAKLLVKRGANKDIVSKAGYTTLDYALTLEGRDRMSFMALIDPDYILFGKRILLRAIEDRDVEQVKTILELGANPRLDFPVVESITRGHTVILQLLLDNGANVNEMRQDGVTPLMASISYKRAEAIRLLLAYGADVNVAGTLKKAIQSGEEEVVNLLLEYGARVSPDLIIEAIYKGETSTILSLINKCTDIANVTNNVDTPLSVASLKGNVTIVSVLLEHGANIDTQDSNGNTALLNAATAPHQEIVKLLIEKGANVNVKNNLGQTALTIASAPEGHPPLNHNSEKYRKHETVVKMLISKGADVNQSALFKASEWGHDGIIAALVDAGAEIDDKSLEVAISNDHNGVVSIFLKKGIRIHQKPVLFWTDFQKPLTMMQLLLDNGADIDLQDAEGKTVLMVALIKDKFDIFSFLLEHGANPNIPNNKGITVLHFAAYNEKEKFAKKVLEHGADINAKLPNGSTALMLACEKGDVFIVHLLLQRNADTEAQTATWGTAIMIAIRFEHIDIIKLLLSHGVSNLDGALSLAYASNNQEIIRLIVWPSLVRNPEGRIQTLQAQRNARATRKNIKPVPRPPAHLLALVNLSQEMREAVPLENIIYKEYDDFVTINFTEIYLRLEEKLSAVAEPDPLLRQIIKQWIVMSEGGEKPYMRPSQSDIDRQVEEARQLAITRMKLRHDELAAGLAEQLRSNEIAVSYLWVGRGIEGGEGYEDHLKREEVRIREQIKRLSEQKAKDMADAADAAAAAAAVETSWISYLHLETPTEECQGCLETRPVFKGLSVGSLADEGGTLREGKAPRCQHCILDEIDTILNKINIEKGKPEEIIFPNNARFWYSVYKLSCMDPLIVPDEPYNSCETLKSLYSKFLSILYNRRDTPFLEKMDQNRQRNLSLLNRSIQNAKNISLANQSPNRNNRLAMIKNYIEKRTEYNVFPERIRKIKLGKITNFEKLLNDAFQREPGLKDRRDNPIGLWNICPRCVEPCWRQDGCLTIRGHICKETELVKEINAQYPVTGDKHFCAMCGRPETKGESHFHVGGDDAYTGISFKEKDCITVGGGGRAEYIARLIALKYVVEKSIKENQFELTLALRTEIALKMRDAAINFNRGNPVHGWRPGEIQYLVDSRNPEKYTLYANGGRSERSSTMLRLPAPIPIPPENYNKSPYNTIMPYLKENDKMYFPIEFLPQIGEEPKRPTFGGTRRRRQLNRRRTRNRKHT